MDGRAEPIARAAADSVRWVTIDDEPLPVVPPTGLVYSTGPRLAGGIHGSYYVKGPEMEIVVAEALAYELAAHVGLDVPQWAFCRLGDEDSVFFASRAQRVRSGVDQLLRQRLAINPDFLATCIAFDAWTSNRDRNINNVVAEPVGGHAGKEVRLVAIDFEKADLLRGVDRFTVTTYPPSAFRPTGDLGRHCVGLAFPTVACEKIRAVSHEAIRAVFETVQSAMPGQRIPWIESASDFLAGRSRRIEQLVQEVWDA